MLDSLFDNLPVQLAPVDRLGPIKGRVQPNGIVQGAAAVMAGRIEPVDSLDFFPTPPWVIRCLLGEVLPEITGYVGQLRGKSVVSSVWEPACGAGHMAGPMADFFDVVHASDVADYGFPNLGQPCPRRGSFVAERGLDPLPEPDGGVDWVITNPPFNLSLAFARRALAVARIGVVLLVRLGWLEGIERWRFRQEFPLFCAVSFAQRVAMFKGRWDPDGSSATAYAAMIWLRDNNGNWTSGCGACGEPCLERTYCVAPQADARWWQPQDLDRWGGAWPRLDGVAYG
ncbi:hypothetical protein PbB2_00076 [Candidatus Phycosocius bacilliformis]|uniref:Methyltransferase n=1 Tax=Candidatus Phycosocius bacilliformis TaxID=1445552 RepID=A0A2P2E5T0_9PROT|nr:methyltransferase [Candidatus Phycosocius bacilliformis]GBF56420.1 hypothetical protein PbB2_00076 [Candidatus Phycosocius bacilliformis]